MAPKACHVGDENMERHLRAVVSELSLDNEHFSLPDSQVTTLSCKESSSRTSALRYH
jgi:hypothetical protein